jgi:hypothetical protein
MMQFLNASATFPVTVNSTNGPPFGESEIYANVEAQLAAGNNAGFGMQALSINDSIASAYGTESGGNWVANFINYPYAPVHHLQTFQPGSGGTTNASAFTISGISVLGTAVTVSCALDCSLFCGNPSYVYISGSPAGAFDGIHTTNTTCAVDTVDFPLSTYAPNCLTPPSISCGTIWSPNYWPITMPLATQRGATSVEVWECDLDFAFGTSTTSNTCYPSLGSGISSADYLNAISNTLVGIPAGTSFHTDSFYHGWKF